MGVHYSIAVAILVRLPWWTLTSLLPSRRPRKSWNLKKAVEMKALKWVLAHETDRVLNVPSHKNLEDAYGGVWVDPAPKVFIIGKLEEWADKAGAEPIRLPGYWIHGQEQGQEQKMSVEQKPDDNEKVLFFLHGGAYVAFSAHPNQATSNIPKKILKSVPNVKRSFAIEYRLSSIPPAPTMGRFPCALLDALSGYIYLVKKVGFSPSQIVVIGDFAGGNIALALARYVGEYKGTVPGLPDVPGALILLSPWADMSGSHNSFSSSAFANEKSDYIPYTPRPYTVDAPPSLYEPFGSSFVSETPYLSPACRHLTDVRFENFPPTLVAAGEAEVLVDQIRELVERIKRSLGEDKVVYFEAKDAFHDYLVLPFTEPWTSNTSMAISRFLSDTTSKTTL